MKVSLLLIAFLISLSSAQDFDEDEVEQVQVQTFDDGPFEEDDEQQHEQQYESAASELDDNTEPVINVEESNVGEGGDSPLRSVYVADSTSLNEESRRYQPPGYLALRGFYVTDSPSIND